MVPYTSVVGGQEPASFDAAGARRKPKCQRHAMDEATKAGYGVLLMRQALPKSEFYARTTATIRAGLQEPAPGPADTLPFGVLGRGPTRKPLDLAKDAHVKALAKRLDELHGATAQAAARGAPRSDGLDEATLCLLYTSPSPRDRG